jgi:hypothetical protein
VTGDTGTNAQIGASLHEQFADFRVDAHEMRQRVKDRSLSADAVGVHVGAGVDISSTIEEQASGVEETVFGGDVEESRAAEGEQAATGLAAIDQFGIATVDQRWVGVKEGGEIAGAAKEDREDAGSVVARVGSGG